MRTPNKLGLVHGTTISPGCMIGERSARVPVYSVGHQFYKPRASHRNRDGVSPKWLLRSAALYLAQGGLWRTLRDRHDQRAVGRQLGWARPPARSVLIISHMCGRRKCNTWQTGCRSVPRQKRRVRGKTVSFVDHQLQGSGARPLDEGAHVPRPTHIHTPWRNSLCHLCVFQALNCPGVPWLAMIISLLQRTGLVCDGEAWEGNETRIPRLCVESWPRAKVEAILHKGLLWLFSIPESEQEPMVVRNHLPLPAVSTDTHLFESCSLPFPLTPC